MTYKSQARLTHLPNSAHHLIFLKYKPCVAICAIKKAARLLARDKHPNIVRNNVKNKMLHILVAMVRDRQYFQQAA